MDKNKLVLAISIVTASLILGGFFYAIQINKQNSIEKQEEMKIGESRRIEEARQAEISTQKQKLVECMKNADDNYQANFESYCISEGRGANCTSIKRYNSDRVDAIENEEKADCYKQYK